MPDTTRRGFFGLAGKAAAVAGGAAALPVICAGPAFAGGPEELPVVTHPWHPGAVYAAGPETRAAHAEPLNASVDCGLHGRTD
ncbi:hypothetical protein PJ985_16010 [Streptomyces sp. ACA25]|uniref:hypothetical protein n=1 Tax=Streptomyces sp. ACA25 TaxID=3022596 RepID=UPI0023081164|nr:hypothetical protein [Streptomyces sp. ACA25]MDB1089066.1 hypothetical protein [Streptomyces sp. ACA25]